MKLVRYGLCAATLACLYSGIVSPADAQTPSSSPAPAVSAYDSVVSFGQTLKNAGIYLDLAYVEDFSANVSGGVKTGIQPIGHAFTNTVFDLETIAGIKGASLHIQFDERNGHSIDAIVGTQGPLQADAGPVKYALGELYWEQAIDNDRLDILIGRTNPTFDFAFSDISCQFVSSIICAQPGSWYFSNSNVGYPKASWGGRVNFQATPEIYIRTAIYDNDPSQGGFLPAGFNWNVEHSTGVLWPTEIGYQTSFANVQYPAKYDVGFYYDTSTFTTPSFTSLNGVTTGGVGRVGRTAWWAQAQQTVWRPDRATQQSLTVFGGLLMYNGNTPYWGQYYAGFLDRAPFLSRQSDTVALIGSLYQMNQAVHPNKSTQWIFEANYGAVIVPGITFKPYTQYIISPNDPTTTEVARALHPSNAWVVGFQVVVDLGVAFQFPQFIPH